MNAGNIIPGRVAKKHKLSGVTLIELMVSLTIGLIILAAVGYIYLGSKQTFRSQDALSRMQESARTAFEIIGRDLRMTGFTGCPKNTAAEGDINVLSGGTTTWYKNLYGEPLKGYEKGAEVWTAFPAGVTGVVTKVEAGDVLTILHADNTKEYIVQGHDTGTYMLTLTANHDLKNGQALIVAKADCSRTALFQKTNACTGATSCDDNADALVKHGTSSGTPTYDLGVTVTSAGPPPVTSPAVDTFGANSRIYKLSAATYYINDNDAGERTLFRAVPLPGATTTPEELIEGVEDMQIVYGEDTSAPADGTVDVYRTADAVANWANVLGVRISLLMATSEAEQGITTKGQAYKLDRNGDGDFADTGETVSNPGDTRLRKVFTTTIAIKNRL